VKRERGRPSCHPDASANHVSRFTFHAREPGSLLLTDALDHRGIILTLAVNPWHALDMSKAPRKALGQFIIADPRICGGRPTFKGTRVTVADVLADVERGLSWDFICYRWGDGKITKEALTEAVQLARRALLTRAGHLAEDVAAAA
jgi:uncharacterized protein (DUF433 family)